MAFARFNNKNVEPWITSVNAHLDQNEIPQTRRGHVAIALLPAAEQMAVHSLTVALSNITETQWIWTWDKLQPALRGMSGEFSVLISVYPC